MRLMVREDWEKVKKEFMETTDDSIIRTKILSEVSEFLDLLCAQLKSPNFQPKPYPPKVLMCQLSMQVDLQDLEDRELYCTAMLSLSEKYSTGRIPPVDKLVRSCMLVCKDQSERRIDFNNKSYLENTEIKQDFMSKIDPELIKTLSKLLTEYEQSILKWLNYELDIIAPSSFLQQFFDQYQFKEEQTKKDLKENVKWLLTKIGTCYVVLYYEPILIAMGLINYALRGENLLEDLQDSTPWYKMLNNQVSLEDLNQIQQIFSEFLDKLDQFDEAKHGHKINRKSKTQV